MYQWKNSSLEVSLQSSPDSSSSLTMEMFSPARTLHKIRRAPSPLLSPTCTFTLERSWTPYTRTVLSSRNYAWENLPTQPPPASCKFNSKTMLKPPSSSKATSPLASKSLLRIVLRTGNLSALISVDAMEPTPFAMLCTPPPRFKTKRPKWTCSSPASSPPLQFSQTALVSLLSPTSWLLASPVRPLTRSLRRASKFQRCRCSTWTSPLLKSSSRFTAEFSLNSFPSPSR
jgi:hypothetical protein